MQLDICIQSLQSVATALNGAVTYLHQSLAEAGVQTNEYMPHQKEAPPPSQEGDATPPRGNDAPIASVRDIDADNADKSPESVQEESDIVDGDQESESEGMTSSLF